MKPIEGVETSPKKIFPFVKSIDAAANNHVSYKVLV